MICESRIIDMIMGAILLGAGLLFLTSQYRSVTQLVNMVGKAQIGTESFYQQYSNSYINNISDEELYAILMGYREYPIVIDGVTIASNNLDYEDYFSIIKEGYYGKSYRYDTNHVIIQIVFTYAGG